MDFTNAKFVREGQVASGAPKVKSATRQYRPTSAGYYSPSATGSYNPTTGQMTDSAAFPYWFMMMWGIEPVYRLMMQQQTLALARYVVTGPIRASTWDITWDDSIDKGDPAIRWTKDNILPLRKKVIGDALRCVDYGYQPFSIPWEIRDGLYYPDVRALLPDSTTILQDSHGNFAGIQNRGIGEAVEFNNLESWVPTLDSEAGYAYGRSRFENVRTNAWAPWLNTVMRMRELEQKLSGIIPIVTHPPGGYVDDNGNAVNYTTEAQTILSELPQGRGVGLQTALDVQQLLDNPEFAAQLAKLRLFDVQFLDAGSVSPAVVGFISLLEYWDKQLFRGMLRGERAGLEAVAAGSRADSEQHTETGAADSEAIDAELTDSFDQHVLYTALSLNFGEEKARRIHVISTPLQQWKKQVFRELITRLVSIPSLAIDVAKALDMDAIFTQLSLPELNKFVATDLPKPPAPGEGLKGEPKPTKAQLNQLATQFSDYFHK